MNNNEKSQENLNSDTPAEFDPALLKNGVRGKYYARLQEGSNVALLAPDVAAEFRTSDAVNEALRGVIQARKAAYQCTKIKKEHLSARRKKNTPISKSGFSAAGASNSARAIILRHWRSHWTKVA